MSKNIIIQEGGDGRQFTADKLKTALIGGEMSVDPRGRKGSSIMGIIIKNNIAYYYINTMDYLNR